MTAVAIFDFCDTIIMCQTADRFVEHVVRSHQTTWGRGVLRVRHAMSRLLPGPLRKRLTLLALRGQSTANIEQAAACFVREELLPLENAAVAERIREHQRRGDTVVIVSAGYAPYIAAYAREKSIRHVVATELQTRGSRLTGFIDGYDCIGERKVQMLSKMVDLSRFDMSSSYVYSDSLSDLPLFRMVGNRVFVSGGCAVPARAAEYGLTVLEG